MPIQTMNFQNAPISPGVLSQLLPAIQQGLQIGAMPNQIKQQSQAQALQNALKQIQLQFAPQQAQADIDEKNALTPYYQAMTKNIPVKSALDQQMLQLKLQELLQKQNQPDKVSQQEQVADYKSKLAQQTSQSKDWNTLISQASQDANSANKLDQYANQFDTSYGKTSETGSLGGKLPALSSDAQNADRASQLMVSQMLNLIKGGRLTNSQLSFLQGLKPNRSLNTDAENQAIQQVHASTARAQEYVPFLNYAKSKGLGTDEAKSLWSQYDQMNPLYDNSTQSFNPKKIGLFKQFIDNYSQSSPGLSSPAFNENMSGSSLPLNNQQIAAARKLFPQNSQNQSLSSGDTVTVKLPDGRIGTVPKKNLQAVLQGGAQVVSS